MTWEKFTAEEMPISHDDFARRINDIISKNNLPHNELLAPPKEVRGFGHSYELGKVILCLWHQDGGGLRQVLDFHAGRTYEFDNVAVHCGFDGRLYQIVNEFQMFACCVNSNCPPELVPYPGTDDLVMIEMPE
jgi:hypothetical protein